MCTGFLCFPFTLCVTVVVVVDDEMGEDDDEDDAVVVADVVIIVVVDVVVVDGSAVVVVALSFGVLPACVVGFKITRVLAWVVFAGPFVPLPSPTLETAADVVDSAVLGLSVGLLISSSASTTGRVS